MVILGLIVERARGEPTLAVVADLAQPYLVMVASSANVAISPNIAAAG